LVPGIWVSPAPTRRWNEEEQKKGEGSSVSEICQILELQPPLGISSGFGFFTILANQDDKKTTLNKKNNNNNYAPLYASLPLHRVVLLREPSSWLMSRFQWNRK
jgi:hypothetical protein